MTEREEAEKIAHAILDGGCGHSLYVTSGPYADPDDDGHILARQFLRSLEKEKAIELLLRQLIPAEPKFHDEVA